MPRAFFHRSMQNLLFCLPVYMYSTCLVVACMSGGLDSHCFAPLGRGLGPAARAMGSTAAEDGAFEVLVSFGRIGFNSLGGGNAMTKLIEAEAVERRQWLTIEEFGSIFGREFTNAPVWLVISRPFLRDYW